MFTLILMGKRSRMLNDDGKAATAVELLLVSAYKHVQREKFIFIIL